MPSYRERGNMAQQTSDLLRHYPDKTAVIEAALERLHRWHYPDQHDAEPSVIGWDAFTTSKPAICSDTGAAIPAGATAYREVWSDGRAGAILSRESLIADGAIDES